MPAYSRLTDTQIAIIRACIELENSHRDVARVAGCSHTTVRYWLRAKTRSPPRQPPRRTPRAVKATKARRALVKKLARKKINVNGRTRRLYSGAKVIRDVLEREHDTKVTSQTVRNDLRALDFTYCARRKDMSFTPADKAKRVAFARAWKKKLLAFTDEKTFTCGDYTNNFEWVQRGDKPTEKDRSSTLQDSVYVFGCIGLNFRKLVVVRKSFASKNAARRRNHEERPASEKLTSSNYIAKCLSTIIPHLQQTGTILQQDGHRSHYSKETLGYLGRKNVKTTIGWPARSPDLNPIENLWAHMQKEVSLLVPRNADELEAAIWQVWNELTDEFVNAYVRSFDSKCRKVISVQGSMT